MLDVAIALIPAVLSGIYFYGARVLLVIGVTILASLLAEYASLKTLGKDVNTIKDFSAVVTGLILALNFPPTLPLWIAAVGGAIAIVIVKQMFGGLGQNFMNPAMAARVILMISWPAQMTNWITSKADAVATATPLALVKKGSEIITDAQLPTYAELFLGKMGGSIGEASVLALLLGAAYLVYRKVITLDTPLAFIATVAALSWVFAGNGLFAGDFVYHVLSGGLIFGAFFMATDYSTSPITSKGRAIMGIGLGLLTVVIRLYTNYPEGVSFAILLMNILVPLIERFTVPKSFGGEKRIA
jgi:electron transport complex protein RnfD